MALSYIEAYGTGSQFNFPYSSISLLDDDLVSISSQLRVYIDGTLKIAGTDYTVNTVTQNVQFVAAPLGTELVRIARFTKDDDRYINYTNSTNVTAAILNTDATQIFFMAQEAKDLQNDAMVVGSDGKWNGQSRIIGHISAGIDGTDAVNVAQLQAAALGTTPAALGGHGYESFTGDGTTTDFALPTAIATITSSEDIQVFISGVYQTPANAYSITGGNIVFSPAPSSGAKIEVLWLQGVLSGILGADAVDTDAIQNNSVTVAKIDAESATTGHVLKATGSGNAAFGTITSSVVSDLATTVKAYRLDEFAAPTVSVSMGSQKIVNLANPTASNDAVNLSYFTSNLGTYDKNQTMTLGIPSGVGGQVDAITARTGTYTSGTTTDCWRGGHIDYTFNVQPGSVSFLVPLLFGNVSGTAPNATIGGGGASANFHQVTIPLSSYGLTNITRPVIVLLHDSQNQSDSLNYMRIFWDNPSGNRIRFFFSLGSSNASPVANAQLVSTNNRQAFFQSGAVTTPTCWTRKNTL